MKNKVGGAPARLDAHHRGEDSKKKERLIKRKARKKQNPRKSRRLSGSTTFDHLDMVGRRQGKRTLKRFLLRKRRERKEER